jgi:hypothetical protein
MRNGALELTLGRSLVVGDALSTADVGPLHADYQHKELYYGAIVRFTYACPLGEHLLANSYVSLKRLEYRDYAYLTGNQYWVGTTLRYGLDPTSAVWTSVSLGRNLARDALYSYSAVGGGAGLFEGITSAFQRSGAGVRLPECLRRARAAVRRRAQRSASAA